MSNHKNLLFFNKEGDYLNFNYSDVNDRFEGNILFHENSSDTYKTAGIYMLESIPSFEYEVPGELTLNKFQLFNEYGLHLYGAKWIKQKIDRIEPINNDPNFYSKWIYGDHFESRFPIGTIVNFDFPFLEFIDINKTYVVVSTKKGAIMIISEIDNATFESIYFSSYSDSSIYVGKTLSGINCVGIYNYIDNSYANNLSNWSEPNFYDKYYVGKKLNIVGSDLNDGTVTVTNDVITDSIHFEYSVSPSSLPINSDIIIEVLTRTDLPNIYNGPVSITSDSKVFFTNTYDFPKILKTGIEFKITGSVLNDIFLTVSDIPNFDGTTQTTFYPTQSQVIYNNRIYQCVQAYTHSHGSQSTRFITPLDSNFWSNPTYVSVNQPTTLESLLSSQLYLTTDRFYFGYGWTYSSLVTLASAVEKYKSDLQSFNIDLYYDNTLKADLVYPSKYAEVNFYHTQVGPTYSIGSIYQTNERLVEVKEELNYELNYNYSSNFKYNIVFTDIDEFGIIVKVNKMVYDVEVSFIYTGSVIDMERTIDRTLRNWLARNYLRLYSLGINAELSYIGNFASPFYNSIILETQYPNVPIEVNSVEVGTTANYYIEHSRVLFTGSGTPSTIGPNLSITINDKVYEQQTINIGTSSNVSDIPATLAAWVTSHSSYLSEFGILVTNINNLLKFDVKDLNKRLTYTIKTGKIDLPGLHDYIIINKISGNEGMLISSNEVVLPSSSTASFEEAGFATGMVFSINNTSYTWNNQEYNIQFLDPSVLNLSYQGPFWGLTDSICNSSAFITLAFSLGFGQTACEPIVGPTGGVGGPFDPEMFNSSMFSLSYNPNTYVINTYNLNSYLGTSNLVDIMCVQLSNSIYSFGDNLLVMDSTNAGYITTVLLPGNTQSMQMEFNPINNYIYCLSSQQINIVDPLLNLLIANISLTSSVSSTASAFDMEIDPINGDVYVTYNNYPKVNIWSYNNFTSVPYVLTSMPPSVTRTGKMVFNDFEGDMYITTDADLVLRVNGGANIPFPSNPNRSIQTTYGIPGLTHSIFYEPVNESIYVYGSSSLWKIDNGITQSISISSYNFDDVIFNNLTGEMNISDTSTNFTRLDLNTNTTQATGVANYGYIALNQFDGDVYLSSQNLNNIIVVRPSNGVVVYTAPMSAQTTKLIYNPDRKSIWTIQPSSNSIIEVAVNLNSSINILPSTSQSVGDNQYGTLHPDYEPRPGLWLKTREYIRKPRENFEGETPVKFYWKWLSDNVPQFFMYDLSGDQLASTGSYSYTGPKPLTNAVLNKYPNKSIYRVSIPEYQQTVFDKIEYTLSYIDDSNDISTDVESLQLSLGFKSPDEGSLRSILQLYKKEEVEFDIISSSLTNITFETIDPQNLVDKRGLITIDPDSSENFTGRGLKVGQKISFLIKDVDNKKSQYISNNNGIIVKIREIYTKILVVDFYNTNYDFIETESTVVSDFPTSGQNTYLKTTISVIDREIGRFLTYGQTEIEDVRFKIELGNIGKSISPNEVFIFKEYDILEGATDWTFLNKKRKEMLMMKHLIYPYIGSYKSIINAINYFGYNDLQLNEYYRNVDTGSENFSKLFKVEIPDIFDNTVEGWTENDFIKHLLPNDKFDGTNLLNLTYFITDKDGTNILGYSLDEIIIKLQGLKYWLKRNIIPLTHKILDITGRSYVRGGNYIKHRVQDVRIIKIKDNMTPVTSKLNEAYLMPVNSGSTVYNCVLDFYSIIPKDPIPGMPTPMIPPPKPYNGVELVSPDYFNIKIRTYKTYKEWAPFTTYEIDDKVTYYGKLYQSVISSNKVKNPRKYENVKTWSANSNYFVTNEVNYNNDIFVFSGLGSTQSLSIPPILDNGDGKNWLKITEWKKIDYEPVQTISEFRKGDDTLPFNFTIDSNIDPFIIIEVTSDNGYGLTYMDKKNYEIRGLKDLTQPYKYIDPIGPFVPIAPVY